MLSWLLKPTGLGFVYFLKGGPCASSEDGIVEWTGKGHCEAA